MSGRSSVKSLGPITPFSEVVQRKVAVGLDSRSPSEPAACSQTALNESDNNVARDIDEADPIRIRYYSVSIAGHHAFGQLAIPIVEQRPVDRTRAKVGHVQITLDPSDCVVEQRVVFAEDRAMTR